MFTDTVDIHERASRRNQYGPVLFALDVNVLNGLPPGSEVLMTKKNPTKWIDGEPMNARFFANLAELQGGLVKGTFDQMVVLRAPGGILPFPPGRILLTVDDPRRNLADAQDAYAVASARLTGMATSAGSSIAIGRRVCQPGSKCGQEYASGFLPIDALFR